MLRENNKEGLMVCRINCATITGVDVLPVIVETDICNGLPSFDMVGLLSKNQEKELEPPLRIQVL